MRLSLVSLLSTLALPTAFASYTGTYCSKPDFGNCPSTIPGSSFKPVICGTNNPSVFNLPGYVQPAGMYSAATCATACRAKAAFLRQVSGACICADDLVSVEPGPNCTFTMFYAHSPAAEASQLVRRRLRDVATDENKYCPPGLTPCRIAGSDDGYECINTVTELESCGGCPAGVYSTDDTPALETLPKVRLRQSISAGRDFLKSVSAPDVVGVDCSKSSRGRQVQTCRKGSCVDL